MVQAIRIKTTIGEDRRLVIDLPDDTPVGPVELVIQPAEEPAPVTGETMIREEARAKLLAAGALATWIKAPPGTVPLTAEELLKIGQLPPDARPSHELIDEDWGEY